MPFPVRDATLAFGGRPPLVTLKYVPENDVQISGFLESILS